MISKKHSEHGTVLTGADFDRLSHLAKSPRYRAKQSTLLAGLENDLSRGTVISSDRVPKAVVTMNSRVRVRDTRTHEAETFTLVYPEEADIAEGKLSVLAPLGRALLGARARQIISVHAPVGERTLKVERILYQPEAAGDFHL